LEMATTLEEITEQLNGLVGWDQPSYIGELFDRFLEIYLGKVESHAKVTRHERGLGLSLVRLKGTRFNNKWLVALDGIKPRPFEIRFKNKYSDDDEWLHPCLKTKMDASTWVNIAMRAKKETLNGHFLNMPQIISVLRATIGWAKAKEDPYLGMIRYYIDSVFGKDEPYAVSRDGSEVINISHDSMACTRMTVLINACWFNLNWGHLFNPNVLAQFTEFLFDDPHYHSNLVKKPIALMGQSAMCISTTGKRLEWNALSHVGKYQILTGFQIRELMLMTVFIIVICQRKLRQL